MDWDTTFRAGLSLGSGSHLGLLTRNSGALRRKVFVLIVMHQEAVF